MAIPAEVVVIMGRSGTKGVYRVRAKLIGDIGKNKIIVRNVLGPVKIGDIVMITQKDMDAAGELD
jgi:small subunit ribosomal protein S28e